MAKLDENCNDQFKFRERIFPRDSILKRLR